MIAPPLRHFMLLDVRLLDLACWRLCGIIMLAFDDGYMAVPLWARAYSLRALSALRRLLFHWRRDALSSSFGFRRERIARLPVSASNFRAVTSPFPAMLIYIFSRALKLLQLFWHPPSGFGLLA